MTTDQYEVAGHTFSVRYEEALAPGLASQFDAYRPFETKKDKVLFNLNIEVEKAIAIPASFSEEARQEEEGQTIISGKLEDGQMAFIFRWAEEMAVVVSTADYREATLIISQAMQHCQSGNIRAAIDTSLMLLYAFATASRSTLLFHSSTVVWQDKAYMFLGKSGTGKSTHTQLWLKHIEGTHLLNDDNPVVRIAKDGTPMVCGSPWSGKTPCYKNEVYPIGGIVKLDQYPENRIKPLSVLEAYAIIKSSVSSKRWEQAIADGLHNTTEAIIKSCKVFHLDCLPDEAAAKLCWKTIAEGKQGNAGNTTWEAESTNQEKPRHS